MSDQTMDDIYQELKLTRYIAEENLKLQQELNDQVRTANLIALYDATSRNAAVGDEQLNTLSARLLGEIRHRIQF